MTVLSSTVGVLTGESLRSADGDGIRRLRASDIPALLTLARDEIPDTMAARLGPRFADRYHRALLDEPSLQLDGYFVGGELLGFIVYSHAAQRALRSAFARNRLTFAGALLLALLSPRRLAYVIRIGATVLCRLPEPGAEVQAELLTIAVRRRARGGGSLRRDHGVNVPLALVARAFEHLRGHGVTEVKVFCKPEEDDPAANGFVRKIGFGSRGRVARWGLETNLYVRQIPPAGERLS